MMQLRTRPLVMTTLGMALLAGEASAQPTTYRAFGIEHEDIGLASHALNPDGSLTVSNIGSSGLDGVSINLGEAESFAYTYALQDPGNLPTGAWFETRIFGHLNGLSDQFITSVGVTKNPTGFNVTHDASAVLPTSMLVEALLGGAVVDSVTLTAPFPSVVASVLSYNAFSYAGAAYHPDEMLVVLGFTVEISGVLPGSSLVTLDELRITSSGLGVATPGPNQRIEARAADVSSFTLSEEGIGQFGGHFHTGLGAAQIDGVGDLDGDGRPDLVISNIGSSGLDGVSVNIAIPFTLFDSTADPVDVTLQFAVEADPFPPGTGLTMEADGSLDNLNPPGSAPMSMSLTGNTTFASVTADFSPIGATSARIVVLNDGAFIRERVVPLGGDLATIGSDLAGDPQVSNLLASALIPMFSDKKTLPGFSIRLDRDATITPAGFVPEIGDEVLVVADDASDRIGSLTTVRLIGNNEPPIAIVQEPARGKLFVGGLSFLSLGEPDYRDEDSDGDGVSDQLVISNIGSSGLDGVSIPIGPAEGWFGEVDFGPAGALAPGMSARFAMTTEPFIVGNDPPEAAIVISEDPGGGGGGGRITLDYSSAPGDTLKVQVISDGLVVDEVDFAHPFPDPLLVGNIGSSGKDGVSSTLRHRERAVTPVRGAAGGSDVQETEFLFFMPVAGLMTISGSDANAGNLVRCVLASPGPIYDPDDPITIKFNAGNFQPATISGAGLLAHELTHVVQGNAGIRAISDLNLDGRPDLVVSNIGSSGQDGVSIDLNDDWSARGNRSQVALYKIEHGNPPGVLRLGGLSWDVVGQIDAGSPGERIMQPTFGESGGVWDVSIAPMPWAAPETVTVEVFDAGIPTGSVAGLAPGSVASVVTPEVPGVYEWSLLATGGATSQGIPADGVRHTFLWDSSVSLTLPGLSPVSGDELRITSQSAPARGGAPASHFIDAQFTNVQGAVGPAATEAGTLVITGETIELIDPCPADSNGSGDVNVVDLLDLLGKWGPCPGPPDPCFEDNTGDGAVSVVDLLALLGAWGPCP